MEKIIFLFTNQKQKQVLKEKKQNFQYPIFWWNKEVQRTLDMVNLKKTAMRNK